MSESLFNGFPPGCLKFYEQLRQNNTKTWFGEHREDFEKDVMAPARLFVHDMGMALKQISPDIIADPRVNRSIFRPFRDTRFSHDKTPYKTHLGIFFWEGRLAKMDCPGYYFHLEPPTVMLGVGNHCFSKDILTLYRNCVVDPVLGKELAKAVKSITSKSGYEIGIQKYKQVPRGFDKNHANAKLLLFGGLTASCQMPAADFLGSSELVNFCFEKFKDMHPVHNWLVKMNLMMPETRK